MSQLYSTCRLQWWMSLHSANMTSVEAKMFLKWALVLTRLTSPIPGTIHYIQFPVIRRFNPDLSRLLHKFNSIDRQEIATTLTRDSARLALDAPIRWITVRSHEIWSIWSTKEITLLPQDSIYMWCLTNAWTLQLEQLLITIRSYQSRSGQYRVGYMGVSITMLCTQR